MSLQIVFFRIRNISEDYIHLEWNVENCHFVEIKGIGNFGFMNNVIIPRNRGKSYEFELVAWNIENNKQVKDKLVVYPSPFVEGIKLLSKGKSNYLIKADYSNIKKIRIVELALILEEGSVFELKNFLNNEITLHIEGFNNFEALNLVLKIPQRNNLFFLLPIFFLLQLMLLVFILAIIPHSRKNELNNFSECNPGKDTLQFVKTKIIELVNNCDKIKETEFNDNVRCLKRVKKNTRILFFEKTKSGYNYHEIENAFKFLNTDKFLIDSFSTEMLNGFERINIIGKLTETIDTNKYKIPLVFQGQVNGKTRRINILKQSESNNKIEFTYSVFGMHNEQSKKGIIDLNNMTFNMDTYGKGKVIISKDETIFQLESDNSKLISFKN